MGWDQVRCFGYYFELIYFSIAKSCELKAKNKLAIKTFQFLIADCICTSDYFQNKIL